MFKPNIILESERKPFWSKLCLLVKCNKMPFRHCRQQTTVGRATDSSGAVMHEYVCAFTGNYWENLPSGTCKAFLSIYISLTILNITCKASVFYLLSNWGNVFAGGRVDSSELGPSRTCTYCSQIYGTLLKDILLQGTISATCLICSLIYQVYLQFWIQRSTY